MAGDENAISTVKIWAKCYPIVDLIIMRHPERYDMQASIKE